MRRNFRVLVPFILVCYPVLFLLSTNIKLLAFNDVVGTLAFALLGTLAVFLFFRLVLRETEQAVFLTSISVILFFSYGHIFDALNDLRKQASFFNAIFSNRALVPLWVILFLLALYFARRQRHRLKEINKYLGIVGGILVVVAATNVLVFALGAGGAVDISLVGEEFLSDDVPLNIEDPNNLPDIYYIIPDAYSRNDILLELYGFDNSLFLDELRERGFYIAEESRSNYQSTYSSIPSSLNIGFLDFLDGQIISAALPDQLVTDNRVSRILKKAGYQIVHFASGYRLTNQIEIADVTYDRGMSLFGVSALQLTDFTAMLLRSTALRPVVHNLTASEGPRDIVFYNFDVLRGIPEIEEPTFTFVHLLVPHYPMIFRTEDMPIDADSTPVDGQIVGDGLYTGTSADIPGYLQQVNFVNRLLIETIDELLERSDIPPIIVVQADHGYRPRSVFYPEAPYMREVTVMEQREPWGAAEYYRYLHPILNAYYLPGSEAEHLYPSITPVNTFRLVLDAYLGTELGLLEDRSYYYHASADRYDMIEVTGGILRDMNDSSE